MKESIVIDAALLNRVSLEASQNPRLRKNYNFHSAETDTLHRLLNAMHPGTYIRPHRHLHPDKDDIILVLRGSVKAFLFDDNGAITQAIVLSHALGRYGMEVAPGIWHGLVVLEPDTVLYEVKEGPYAPLSPENWASWAPDPMNKKEVAFYISQLLKTAEFESVNE